MSTIFDTFISLLVFVKLKMKVSMYHTCFSFGLPINFQISMIIYSLQMIYIYLECWWALTSLSLEIWKMQLKNIFFIDIICSVLYIIKFLLTFWSLILLIVLVISHVFFCHPNSYFFIWGILIRKYFRLMDILLDQSIQMCWEFISI